MTFIPDPEAITWLEARFDHDTAHRVRHVTVYDQPMITFKSLEDSGSPMIVVSTDYKDPERWRI